MSSPVTTVVEASTPCWSRVCHIAGAVVPAQATKSRSGLAALIWLANGVNSVALAGASTLLTVAPAPPMTACTAASLLLPNALSWAKTTTFLPVASPMNDLAVTTSWYDCRPERNVYLLTPVTPSVAAGPEMNSVLFWAAIGATWSATPEAVEPAMIFVPLPIRSLAAETALAGSPASSTSVTSTGRSPILLVPLVAYDRPALKPSMYCLP